MQSQRDVHYEVKVPSALTKTRQAGQGSAAHGGCCASLGHKFGFGGTLDQTLLKVLGCKERGHKSQGPLVHATGKGWVKEHKGQYYDALHVKNGIVKICLVESQGGIAPPTKRIIFNFAKEVGSPSAVDRTDYGTASGSARGFVQHHSQQLSRAAVCGDTFMRVAHSFMDRSQCPTPLRAGLLGPRVVSPHPQGLQGSHLNLSQTSAQRHLHSWSTWSAVINLTSRAGELRSAPSGPDDRDRVAGKRALAPGVRVRREGAVK